MPFRDVSPDEVCPVCDYLIEDCTPARHERLRRERLAQEQREVRAGSAQLRRLALDAELRAASDRN